MEVNTVPLLLAKKRYIVSEVNLFPNFRCFLTLSKTCTNVKTLLCIVIHNNWIIQFYIVEYFKVNWSSLYIEVCKYINVRNRVYDSFTIYVWLISEFERLNEIKMYTLFGHLGRVHASRTTFNNDWIITVVKPFFLILVI